MNFRSLVLPSLFLMFNFSANHLLLLSRMEYRSCVVFLMKDDSTRRVYRLYDFTKSQTITSDHYYCVWERSIARTNSTWLSSRSGGTPNTARGRIMRLGPSQQRTGMPQPHGGPARSQPLPPAPHEYEHLLRPLLAPTA